MLFDASQGRSVKLPRMETTDDEPWILRFEERELDRFSRRQQNAALKFPESARFARPHLIVTLP
jgi:hypothetical protein